MSLINVLVFNISVVVFFIYVGHVFYYSYRIKYMIFIFMDKVYIKLVLSFLIYLARPEWLLGTLFRNKWLIKYSHEEHTSYNTLWLRVLPLWGTFWILYLT